MSTPGAGHGTTCAEVLFTATRMGAASWRRAAGAIAERTPEYPHGSLHRPSAVARGSFPVASTGDGGACRRHLLISPDGPNGHPPRPAAPTARRDRRGPVATTERLRALDSEASQEVRLWRILQNASTVVDTI